MEYNHYKYVIKYFELKYCTYFNHFSEEHKKKMCMEISQKVRNKFNSLKDVLDGKADDYIMSMINGTVNIVRPKLRTDYLNLRNYIIKYINENDFVNYDEKTLYVIVEQICTDLMPVYSQTRIIEGKLDEDILRCYEKNLKLLAEKIRRYVTKYISENIVPIDGVNNVEVENEILRLIMNTNDINAFDFLIGRCDEKIRDVAEKNREDNINKRRAELPDTFKYIKNLIEIYSEDDIKLVDECVSKVDIRLRDQGLTSKEIVSGKYDYTIRKLYNEYKMKSMHLYVYNNSVKNDDEPDSYKPIFGKIDMDLMMKRLVVTATLVGLVSAAGYGLGQNIRTNYYGKEVSKFDDYRYSSISNIYSDKFELTMENIINKYFEYRDAGDRFGSSSYDYLPFYQAYRSVSKEKLYVMDNMLAQIKEKISSYEGYDDLRNILKYNGCYLDFIYDRLEEMGFDEIKESKYIDLLSSYMKVMHDHKYDDPVEHLSSSEKRLLSKVLEMYEDYSEQALVEFGVLLHNESEKNLTDVTSRRGH